MSETKSSVMPTMPPGKTLLKLRMLANEAVIGEYTDRPVCKAICLSGTTRCVQLTTHRVSYLETRRKWCCVKAPQLLRQVFIKDICEVSVDNHRRHGDSYLGMFFKFIFLVVSPIAGIALIVYNQCFEDSSYDGYYVDYYYDRSKSPLFTIIGGALLAVWLIAVIIVLCRRPGSQIIIGTRCPQLPAFVIALRSKKDCLNLLEELSDLLDKHQ
ncbi:hypothetical protein Poli38472_005082 [Pythium oligandrum]|uniref:Uncharacterized protein n=1 Tax=Pythium oligandrum TaxID=41045 RepID=A0A8K1CG85_PYTOL|nr:hypothetical protein Poli38472_005082 [Pythium oligandrum]|eukprot:TMW62464.1 hypothetical protein Poli38472_005082 [Pythium oligandrum]